MQCLRSHKPDFLRLAIFMCCLGLSMQVLQAQQCLNKIEHLSGTQQIGCTDVTVTSAGGVSTIYQCSGVGPYAIGVGTPGSYTFSFSTPVTGVTLDAMRIDNHEFSGGGHEELSVTINGAPYLFTDAGLPGCDPLAAVISPLGNLMAPNCGDPMGCFASCEDAQIDQTISTITVSDLIFGGNQAGVIFSIYFCCGQCLVDAGVLTSPVLQLCPGSTASLLPSTNTFLPSGTLLQYILFSDLNDTLGSIISTSNTPNFTFNPATMQEGTPYYIASIAGDNLNGNVDLNSYCLDFSNAIEVNWWPKPAVVFSVDDPDVCLGNCTTVTVTFTGEPPFSLTYTSAVTGPTTKNFPDAIGTFEICVPASSLSGSLLLKATALTDAHCICN